MAQNGWESIYTQTQTTSDDWTPITEGTTQGKILGAAQSGSSATYYYYVTKSLNFTNNRTDNDGNGNSGLKIHGTVYLYVPAGLTITCEGANADGRTGAGAGIELASGNTLYIIGGGTVNATGGNAANGRNGDAGTNAEGDNGNSWTRTGTGGTGGNGGGGAGAGIGTRGGTGGTGGAGGAGYKYDDGAEDDAENGTDGTAGTAGGSAGAMGNLYVANGTEVNATGGATGTSGGAGGQRGRGFAYDGSSYNVTVAGGGGGGGGGFGGAASDIGTGGPGGGGGGGGAGGSQDWRSNSSGGVYNVNAYGGKGGTNANGNNAGDGEDADCRSYHVVVNGSFKDSDWNPASGDASFGGGGSGGGTGSASSGGTQHEGSLTYNVTYTPIKTKLNGTDLTPRVVTYNAGVGSVILPENADGYQWVLRVYGKSCAPNGTSASQFATPTENYFGGYGTSELERTVVLANVYGDIEFQEIATFCKLNNNGSNTQALAEFILAQYPVTVRLMDRTLYKDGDWNTLCLPFNMTAAQIAVSPLAGATIYKMDEENTNYYPGGYQTYNYPVLYFRFTNASNSDPVIQAGKPYLVKWVAKDDDTADGNLVDNTKKGGSRHELDFYNVMVSATTAENWSGNNITFQGTLQSSGDLIEGDKTKLVLGKNNMLYYPGMDMNIGACRGYFVIPPSVANLLPGNPSNARQFVMSFDDGGETTSIQTFNVTPESQNDTPVYNLNGQRLSAPKKGINIVNGKKVLVK